MAALRAGRSAWTDYDGGESGLSGHDKIRALYQQRWDLYTGTAFSNMAGRMGQKLQMDQRVYTGIALMWKHQSAVVDFYAMSVYQGDISTDGQPLPDGSAGAIPLDPQTGSDEQNVIVRKAFAELCNAWNWRLKMTQRPMYGAALGDCLTELIDEPETGMVYPSIVWPGFVTHMELDYVDNVKAYTLAYKMREEISPGQWEEFDLRKEVDGEATRYFKNGKPYAFFGPGTEVIENPYGFVPAIWDRHQITMGVRGAAATDSTLQPVIRLNSLLTHAMDFQANAFGLPIIVRGRIAGKNQRQIDLSNPPGDRAGAETTHWLQGDGDVGLVQPTMDIGQTLDIINLIVDGIERENPEATFYKQLREMTQVSAPGAERMLGDAVSRCRRARAGYDINTVKLFQMAMTMCGMRASLSEYDGGWARPLTRRQQTFLPFTLDSYKAGAMDFGISERPVVPPTESERIELVRMKESLQSRWGFEQIGVDPGVADAILRDRLGAYDSGATGAGIYDAMPPVGA